MRRLWKYLRRQRQGRYVVWGAGRRLDVQVGSPRDLALERVAQREARR